jgi:hypothetical protein
MLMKAFANKRGESAVQSIEHTRYKFPGFSPDRGRFPGEFHVPFAGENGVLSTLPIDIIRKNGAARED